MRSISRPLLALLSFILIGGCAMPMPQPRHMGNPNNPLKRVAILPMENATNDVDGPNFVRGKLLKGFQKRYYNVKPLEETDTLLRDQMGVTLGGQLKMAKIEDLKRVLDVEGVVFGTLMDFDDTTTGLYNASKVRAKFDLVNTMTGETFWTNGIGVICEERSGGFSGKMASSMARSADGKDDVPWVVIESRRSDRSIGEGLAWGLGTKILAKVANVHLARETDEMIRRVTRNLPWGPGTAPLPRAVGTKMPAIDFKMPPPPSFGHMDYGKRDFSALIVSTHLNKEKNESFTSEIPIAKAGNKIRLDIDYARMSRGGEMPPALSKMATLHRGDKKVTYTIYPNKRKYMVHQETDKGYYEKPKITKIKVGSETIDGHPTDKFKVTFTYKDGRVHQGYTWEALDLDRMTIKSLVEDERFKSETNLKDIVLKTPPAHLFEIPPDHTEASNFMELMGNE